MNNVDPIVEDVRSVREKFFSMHNEDLYKLLDYYQQQEIPDEELLLKVKMKSIVTNSIPVQRGKNKYGLYI